MLKYLSLLSFVFLSCSTKMIKDVSLAPDPSTETRPQEIKQTLKINEVYLNPNLNVQTYKERWEQKDRDVYAHRKDIVEHMRLKPGLAVADIGAGTGVFMALFDQKVKPGGKVYAVDISPQFVKYLKQRSSEENLKTVEVVQGQPTTTTLADHSVDVAFVCDTYHHFERADLMIADILRILKPKGRLYIVDFDKTPGKTTPWIIEHVRASAQTVISEVSAGGFKFNKRLKTPLRENYMLEFTRL